MAGDRADNVANGDQSDSDLSDVHPANHRAKSPDTPELLDSTMVVNPELTIQEASDSTDNDAYGDADYDMEASPQSAPSDHDQNQQPSSDDSPPSSKRKAPAATDDEYMRENPELYGLRRSVRLSSSLRTAGILEC